MVTILIATALELYVCNSAVILNLLMHLVATYIVSIDVLFVPHELKQSDNSANFISISL